MNMLCFDQAARVTGWSYWEDGIPIEWGTITPLPKTLRDGPRLHSLRKQYQDLIEGHYCDIIIIEDPVGSGTTDNWKTAQILFQVQGVLIELVASYGINLEIISPSTWQYQLGIHKRDRDNRKKGAREFVEKTYQLENLIQDSIDSICLGHSYLIAPDAVMKKGFNTKKTKRRGKERSAF